MKSVFLLITACLAIPVFGFAPQGASPGDPLRTGKFSGSGYLGNSWQPAPGHGFLGVHVREVDSEVAKEKGLGEERGVEITKIVADSAADNAGMQVGDVVLRYNDERVDGVAKFIRLVRETPIGRRVPMTVFRSGEELKLEATLSEKKEWGVFKGGPAPLAPEMEPPHGKMPEFPMADIPNVFMNWENTRLGIVAESLEPQLAAYFGVKEGVLVRGVSEDTPAARADLKAGDVITKVDVIPVASPREVAAAIRDRKDATVRLTVMRDRKQVEIDVSLEETSNGDRKLNRGFIFAEPAGM